ncbi:MAG: hypothetical protein WC907_01170 [Acholeplasmataceae bacterium]
MNKKQLIKPFIYFIATSLFFVIGAINAYLLFFDTSNENVTVGKVVVNSIVYFEKNNAAIPPSKVETIYPHLKDVYYVNISDLESDYHINNLRVDFDVLSNVDTYFRIRLFDSTTIKYIRADGSTAELVLPTTELIEYEIDLIDDWYYDEINDWFYFKQVTKNEIVSFIHAGLEYNLMPKEYQIQFAIQIEAVQAYLGPINNWGLNEPPWGGEW